VPTICYIWGQTAGGLCEDGTTRRKPQFLRPEEEERSVLVGGSTEDEINSAIGLSRKGCWKRWESYWRANEKRIDCPRAHNAYIRPLGDRQIKHCVKALV
jgi:hypothetical protein